MDDLRALRPTPDELKEAERFVRARDSSEPTAADLQEILEKLGVPR